MGQTIGGTGNAKDNAMEIPNLAKPASQPKPWEKDLKIGLGIANSGLQGFQQDPSRNSFFGGY